MNTKTFGLAPKKPLHFFFLIHNSASMSGAKINALNQTVHATIHEMQAVAEIEVDVQVYVRAIIFNDDATWHVATPIPVEEFKWEDIVSVGQKTSMGSAIRLVNKVLNQKFLGKRNIPPVLILITDGSATDDFDSAIQELLDNPWGRKTVRIALGIGDTFNRAQLLKFVEGNEKLLFNSEQALDLMAYVQWIGEKTIKKEGITEKEINLKNEQKDGYMEESPIKIPADNQSTDIYDENSEELF